MQLFTPSSRRAAIAAIVAAIGLVMFPACTPRVAPDSPTAEGMSGLNEPFRLKVGETKVVADEDLRIWVISVTDDSRCPPDVQCVTAGDAHVQLTVAAAFGEARQLRLSFTDATSASYEKYAVKLVELSPATRAGQPIPPQDYVVTLVVTKTS